MSCRTARIDIVSLIPTPQRPAALQGRRGDSLGSHLRMSSRAPSFQIRDASCPAGPSRRAAGRPWVALGAPAARVVSRFGASEMVGGFPVPATPLSRGGTGSERRDCLGVTARRDGTLHTRSRAQSALFHRSMPRVTHDARHLLDLADACEQAADPILQSATDMESVVAASPGWPGITSAAADRLARGIRLKDAAQHLREDAADTELHAFLAHRAAGGDVILAPLPVVVGEKQDPSAPANDRWSLRSAAARLFGR